jgi:acetate kinase
VLVLVVNAGSSSVKLRVVDDDGEVACARDLPSVDRIDLRSELAAFLDEAPAVEAAGHRVVHGGARFTSAVLLEPSTDRALEELAELAPLHNPPSLAAVRHVQALRPGLPQVACFDTAFHAHMPAASATYALPRDWRERLGIRRFGFHGLSHAWVSRRAAELLDRTPSVPRLVTAHIGAGASLAAVAEGCSVDTTMGFTPLDGLVMSTRSGGIDPGAVLWAQQRGGLTADEVSEVLERRSGLLGLSGTSGDLREVLAAADRGDVDARLAYDVYVYRIRIGVAAMVGALGGLDALAFTGGAGERSARLRRDVCQHLGHLGLQPEELLHAGGGADGDGDRVVSRPVGGPAVLVVQAREDLEIDRHVREVVASRWLPRVDIDGGLPLAGPRGARRESPG